MTLFRAVVIAILAYVSCDVAMPMVPGVFVFSAADSVESLQVKRVRPTPNVAVVVPVIGSLVISPPPVHSERFVRSGETRAPGRLVMSMLPRAALESAPSPEDH